jgi:SAM-dependent methyltransferase
MLREVFTEFHHTLHKLDQKFLKADGLKIELGAGVKPIRDSYPEVLATDVIDSPQLDQVLNAEDMNLKNGSVSVLFGQNCFHHFPHPDSFFKEANRVLSVGGGVILLEPYYGPFASFLFKRLFRTEGFDKDFSSWETPVRGPMNGANQALSYIVFIRDKLEFEKRYPTLKIVHLELCGNYLKYLVSGGLNFRQLLPDWITPVINLFQLVLFPLNRWLSLHHIIIIKKVEG